MGSDNHCAAIKILAVCMLWAGGHHMRTVALNWSVIRKRIRPEEEGGCIEWARLAVGSVGVTEVGWPRLCYRGADPPTGRC